MKILWSEKALEDLEEILEFYLQQANQIVAQGIISKLVDKAEILMAYPELGNLEAFENPTPFEYRYLIEGNHKLIYRISQEQKIIFIARVFDTRRSPTKKIL